MSYQVLARKWRPNRFAELVGQEHVVSAISNALDNDRLHHAYLFTGTRGVGKTTIARIFSKSLNCEQGLSAKPCGQCSTCQEIENGHFIDLLEIDAASRTKVEDTRELLDNVQYKPSRGRYKVYLIDEVHMLSKHSFNALLKTLEEPPPHVKFLLATTDPQKLPVTILSRCLQFNLKALSRSQISQQLDYVLNEEKISFDQESLSQLARAAQGSMRDALSLTDQAIAQGNGVVSLKTVTDMLGLMDKNQVLKVVHGVLEKNSAAVLEQIETMATQAPDYALVLAEIMSLLHQVALTQLVPDACKLETISARAIFKLANSVSPEHIQLLYQIALTGKKDLPYAADPRTGLEMTLIRMLAFSPSNLKLDSVDVVAQMPAASVENAITSAVVDSNAADSANSQELSVEPEEILSPNSDTVAASPPQTEQTRNNEQSDKATHAQTTSELEAQQQNIVQQAEDFGHQHFDYNEVQPVDAEEQSRAEYYASTSSTAEPEEAAADKHNSSSTADLIALRNKLKQSQRQEGEQANPAKKSEGKPPFDLAAIRAEQQAVAPASPSKPDPSVFNTTANEATDPLPLESVTQNPVDVIVDVNNPSAIESLAQSANSEQLVPEPEDTFEAPPWPVEHEAVDLSQDMPISIEPGLEVATVFDPNSHLDEETVGDVTLDIPVFLADKQKVTKAMQVDDWSRLIEDMQVTALTKQLALHSAFHLSDQTVKLILLQNKAHLISDTAKEQLQSALCQALNKTVELEIELGQPINTPYALQLKVNQVRKEYAVEVVNTDPGIQLLQQQFAAQVDEQSIKAR